MKDTDILTLTCKDCENKYTISYGSYRKLKYPNHCKLCRKKYFTPSKIHSKEHRDKCSKRLKEEWKNRSSEDKNIRLSKLFKGRDESWKNISEEDKNKRLKPLLDGLLEFRKNVSDEELANIEMRRINNIRLYHKMMSMEEKEKRDKLLIENHRKYIINRTNEQRKIVSEKSSISHKLYYKLLSDDDKIEYIKAMQDGWNVWFNNLDDYNKNIWASKLSKSNKEYWNNLTEYEWIEWQFKVSMGIFKINNQQNYLQSYPHLQEFENLLSRNGISFYREYPSIVITDINSEWYKINKDNLEFSEFILLSNSNNSNNKYPAFKKSWDYLLYIPFTNKRIYVDIDGDIHDIDFLLSVRYMNTYHGKYISRKINERNLSNIVNYYDERRNDIICNKMIIKYNNGKFDNNDISTLLHNFIELSG